MKCRNAPKFILKKTAESQRAQRKSERELVIIKINYQLTTIN